MENRKRKRDERQRKRTQRQGGREKEMGKERKQRVEKHLVGGERRIFLQDSELGIENGETSDQPVVLSP